MWGLINIPGPQTTVGDFSHVVKRSSIFRVFHTNSSIYTYTYIHTYIYIYIYMVTPPCMTYRCLSKSRWGPLADNKKVKKPPVFMVFD